MKLKLILLTLLLYSSIYAGDENVFGANNVTAASTTLPNCKRVIITITADFVGTIGGVCFSGVANQCATSGPLDQSLTLEAIPGDRLTGVIVTRSAGSFRYFAIQ